LNEKEQIADRIRGTILSMACGNSLGGTCLGMNRKEIMFAVGIRGVHDYTPGLKKSLLPTYEPGSLLADTLTAIEVAECAIENKGALQPEALKKRLVDLLLRKDFLEASPGAHCLLPLRRVADNLPPCDDNDPDSTHVSAAVRAAILGCLPPSTDITQMAISQTQVSQGDKRVWAAAAVLANSVAYFVRGGRLDTEDEVREYVRIQLEVAGSIDPRFAESWDDIAPDLDYTTPAEDIPYSLINVNSHVNEAVPTAVGIFLIFRHDLEEAVASAASAGGDTDTVAAIVGALAGAYHGASAIPERWLNRISRKDQLDKIADQLIKLWG
jgi:ADP-ribosylglycohydrolase